MSSLLPVASPDAIRRIQRVQTVTIAWMSVEAAVSARSPALFAFGGDSAIELFSAMVVLWRFRASDAHEDAERRAARIAGALLFALAAFVAVTSVTSLLGYSEPKPTFLGIAILIAAAVRNNRQCCAEGGRRIVGAVRLPVADRLGGASDQLDLARKVGRPHCGFSDSAAHSLGGTGSRAREGLRLLLIWRTTRSKRSSSRPVVKCWCTFKYPGTRLLPICQIEGGKNGNGKNASTNCR
jgi:hypothetical protein